MAIYQLELPALHTNSRLLWRWAAATGPSGYELDDGVRVGDGWFAETAGACGFLCVVDRAVPASTAGFRSVRLTQV